MLDCYLVNWPVTMYDSCQLVYFVGWLYSVCLFVSLEVTSEFDACLSRLESVDFRVH